jgi:hypothetical protein
MGRQKPNKPSKSPNKRIEEQDKQPNNDPSTNITPQYATSRKNTTDTIKQSENLQTKPYRAHTPIQDIYTSNESMLHHMDKIDRERKLKGQALYQDDDESLRKMDKFEHVNNTEDTLTNPKMGDESSPTQNDSKEAAQDSDASSPSTTTRQKITHRQRDDAKMDKMFAALADNTKLQLKQQEERHAKEIADMRQVNRDTHDLFTTKIIPPQTITMNNHRITAHFNTMTKAPDTLFDGTPENWPIFEHHLLTEAENPTIAWNQHITYFQPDEEEEPLNFLERYFDLPEDISQKLELDLANDKMVDIVQVNSKLYKLHYLKTKLNNCLTPDLALDIDTSMPPGLPNKGGRLFFFKLILHTFPDKEAHKRIIYEYILKLEINESNNMESFERELRRHTIQYEAIQGTEWNNHKSHHQAIPEDRFPTILHRL